MPQAERTILIDRPTPEVFAFFTDHGNDPRWRPVVKTIDTDRPAAVGTVVHQRVKGPMGSGIASDFEITAYEPSTRYAFKVTAGPVRPVGEFRFTPTGAGTRVTLSLNAQLTGAKKLLLARSVQTSMDSEVAALDTAKSVIESG